MGMFDTGPTLKETVSEAEVPQFLKYRNMAERGATELADASAPWIKENLGYESPQRKMQNIAAKTDLSKGAEVQKTYNALMKISPAGADKWMKSIKPVIDQHIAKQKSAQSARDNRGPMQKAVEFAAKARGCVVGDNACLKEAILDAKDYKRSNESDKVETKLHAELSRGIYEAGNSAHEDIARYDQMLTILPDIYTGWGGENIAYPVSQIADFLGLDKASAGKMEVFRSGAMSQALTYIAQTKGAVSDREFGAFREAAAGLSRSELGNKLLLRTAKKYAQFRKKKALELARWTTQERAGRRVPTAAGWQMQLDKWANKSENIIKLPTEDEMKEALGMSTGPSLTELEKLKKRHQALKGSK